jgi:valyl-tRNA synthetase
MDSYQFGEAGRQAYEFLWGDFADWYVEIAKVQLGEGDTRAWTTLWVLRHVLDQALRLLHPYIPYVTEAVWQEMKRAYEAADLGITPDGGWGAALILADWPTGGYHNPAGAADFERVRDLVRAIRAARSEYNVPAGRWIAALIPAGAKAPFLAEQRAILTSLARLDDTHLTITGSAAAPDQAITLALGDITCYLPLAGLVDLDAEKERLGKELADLATQIERVNKLLDSPFAQKAPAAVVQKERDKLAQLQASHNELTTRLGSLN